MKKIRFIDQVSPSNDGTLIDMIYDIIDNKVRFIDLKCHLIIDGIVGSPVNIDAVVKLTFAGYLIQILEQELDYN